MRTNETSLLALALLATAACSPAQTDPTDTTTPPDAGTRPPDAGTPTPTGAIKTVFLIVMENHDWSQVKGSASAPYINHTLLALGAHAEQYKNPPALHPSEPNYLWLEAGSSLGVTTDLDPAVNHQSTTAHLATQLNAAGVSWRSYQEGISGTVCPLTGTGNYRTKHDPFVFFDDLTGGRDPHDAACIAHNRPFDELARDLEAGTVARYNFLTPDLCDDGHDKCGPAQDQVRQTDDWLAAHIPGILASATYRDGGAVFITWDEGNGHSDGPIGMIVLSPHAKAGYENSVPYTHSSTLRTVQEVFGVAPFLGDAARATDLSDLFDAFP